MSKYCVEHYAADGMSGPAENYVIAKSISTLAEARAIVRKHLGVSRLTRARRWPGGDECVEAYHDLTESEPGSYGCGGVSISEERGED